MRSYGKYSSAVIAPISMPIWLRIVLHNKPNTIHLIDGPNDFKCIHLTRDRWIISGLQEDTLFFQTLHSHQVINGYHVRYIHSNEDTILSLTHAIITNSHLNGLITVDNNFKRII